jgi:hypothetical protein
MAMATRLNLRGRRRRRTRSISKENSTAGIEQFKVGAITKDGYAEDSFMLIYFQV